MVDCGGLGSDHGNGFRLDCFRHPTGVYSSKHAELHGSELVVADALSQPWKRLSSLRDGAELRFDAVRLFPPLSTAFDAYGGACERGMRGSRVEQRVQDAASHRDAGRHSQGGPFGVSGGGLAINQATVLLYVELL